MPASKKKETAATEAELSPSLVAELERRVNQVQQHNVIACISAFFNLSCFLFHSPPFLTLFHVVCGVFSRCSVHNDDLSVSERSAEVAGG